MSQDSARRHLERLRGLSEELLDPAGRMPAEVLGEFCSALMARPSDGCPLLEAFKSSTDVELVVGWQTPITDDQQTPELRPSARLLRAFHARRELFTALSSDAGPPNTEPISNLLAIAREQFPCDHAGANRSPVYGSVPARRRVLHGIPPGWMAVLEQLEERHPAFFYVAETVSEFFGRRQDVLHSERVSVWIVAARAQPEGDPASGHVPLLDVGIGRAIRLFLERVEVGSGILYPHSSKAAYIQTDAAWQRGLTSAWQAAFGGQHIDFDVRWWIDYRPSTDDPVCLSDESASVAIACGLLALQRREALRPDCVISAAFGKADATRDRLVLRSVGGINPKLQAPQFDSHLRELIVTADQEFEEQHQPRHVTVTRVRTLEEAYCRLLKSHPLDVTIAPVLPAGRVQSAMRPFLDANFETECSSPILPYRCQHCSPAVLAGVVRRLLQLRDSGDMDGALTAWVVHAHDARSADPAQTSAGEIAAEIHWSRREAFAKDPPAVLVTQAVADACRCQFDLYATHEWDSSAPFEASPLYTVLAARRAAVSPMVRAQCLAQCNQILHRTRERRSDGHHDDGFEHVFVQCSTDREHDEFLALAHDLIAHLPPEAARVLVWRGEPTRKFDLLGAVTESLRALLNLNRNAESLVAVDPNLTQIALLQGSLANALDDLFGQDDHTRIRRNCENLYLGGPVDGIHYLDLQHTVLSILKRHAQLAAAGGLAIVAARIDEFDASSRWLLSEIARLRNVRVICSSSDAESPAFLDRRNLDKIQRPLHLTLDIPKDLRHEDPLAKCTDSARCLAKVAAFFGADTLSPWLLPAWQRALPADARKSLRTASRELEHAGILRRSSRLASNDPEQEPYVEFRFASYEAHAAARQLLDDQLYLDLRKYYATRLSWYLDKRNQNRSPQEFDVGSVRRKILVCEHLSPEVAAHLPPQLRGKLTAARLKWPQELRERLNPALLKLWTTVADRALSIGEPADALQRVLTALNYCDFEAEDFQLSHTLVTLFQVGLLAARRVAARADHESPETSLHRSVREADSNRLERFFKYVKAIREKVIRGHVDPALFALLQADWDYRQAIGDIADALDKARQLKDWYLSGNGSSWYQMEAWHGLAVSQFAAGRLQDALESAHSGLKICELGQRAFNDTRPLDSHCGGACCKIHTALILALRENRVTPDALRYRDLAFEYSDKLGDEPTSVLVRAYWALLQMLLGDRVGAQEFAAQACRQYGSERRARRWRLLAEVVGLSSLTAMDFELKSASPPLSFAFQHQFGFQVRLGGAARREEAREKLDRCFGELAEYGRDFESLWDAYAALAIHVCGRGDHADLVTAIDKSIATAMQRGEQISLLGLYPLRRLVVGNSIGIQLPRELEEDIRAILVRRNLP